MKKTRLKKQTTFDSKDKLQPKTVRFNPNRLVTEEDIEARRRIAQEMLDTHKDTFARIAEIQSQLLASGVNKHLFETGKAAFEAAAKLMVPAEEWQRALKRLAIPESELRRISDMQKLMINDSLLRIPLEGVLTAMSLHQKLTLEVTEFIPRGNNEQETRLTTRFTQETDLGIIQYRAVQEIQMDVRDLRNEVREMREYQYEDGKKKDQMLEDLMAALNDGKEALVKVKKINFDKKYSQLIINDHTIQIRADTNHEQLCSILFANKSSMKKTWEIIDIVEQMCEDIDKLHEWKEIIYNTIRHLNTKIERETGLKRFILFSNKKVLISPAYMKMHK